MSLDGQRIKWRRNIAENFDRLSRVHERYRQQTHRRQTDGRRHLRSLKIDAHATTDRHPGSGRSKSVRTTGNIAVVQDLDLQYYNRRI